MQQLRHPQKSTSRMLRWLSKAQLCPGLAFGSIGVIRILRACVGDAERNKLADRAEGKKAVSRLRVCPHHCLASTASLLLIFPAHGLVLCLPEKT